MALKLAEATRHARGLRGAAPNRVQVRVVAKLAPAHIATRGAPVVRTTSLKRGVYRANTRRHAVVVQANLFGRLNRVIKSFFSSFLDNVEDPERMLDRVQSEMQDDLIKMRQAAARVMASEKQMGARYQQAQDTADEWLKRADLAVRKGQDDLAREALQRRKTYQTTATGLKTQLDAQRKATEQLIANTRMLESKLQEAGSKRETLKARAASAKASRQIQEMIGGLRLNNSSAWAAFDKMEEKVVALEAEAESAGQLATPDSLEQKFAMLEGGGGVEDDLAALKKGVLRGQQRELPPARQYSEVFQGDPQVERELQQLRERARAL